MRASWFVILVPLTLGCPKPSTQLVSLAVGPETLSLPSGEQAAYVATATYDDGTVRDVTEQTLWTVDDAVVASIDSGGQLHALTVGTSQVRARFESRTVLRRFTVSPANLVRLQADPSSVVVPRGVGAPVSLFGISSDGQKEEVTAEATWSSTDATIARHSNGVVRGETPGATTVRASARGLATTIPVDVTASDIVRLEIAPAVLTVPVGASQRLTATAVLNDGTSLEVTTQATWRSSNGSVAAFSQAQNERGIVLARAPGVATLEASLAGLTASASVEVTAATLEHLELTPPLATLAAGTLVRLKVTGVYSDGTVLELSHQARWSSSDAAVASVAGGLVRALAPGRTTLGAEVQGLIATAPLVVSSAMLTGLELSVPQVSLAKGASQSVTVTGFFSDGARQDLTAQAYWSVVDGAVARVGNGASSSGVVTALLEGATTLEATVQSSTARASLTVTAAALVSLVPSSSTLQLPLGSRARLGVSGVYSDGTTADLSSLAVWSSSDASKVRVENGGASHGLVTGAAVGQVTLQAAVGATTTAVAVTVTDAVLTRLELSPASLMLPNGTTSRLQATGIYSDATVAELTELVTWSSSDDTVVKVSNAAAQRGHLETARVGQAEVRASLDGITGSTTVTVGEAIITALELGLPPAALPVGLEAQLSVTALASDGTTRDVTHEAVFESSAASVATVSNLAGTRGTVSAHTVGTTSITARLGGLNTSARLDVGGAVPMSINATPPTLTLAKGTEGTLRVEARLSDGTTRDVTAQVTLSSSHPLTAAVASMGVVLGLEVGTSSIRAQLNALSTQIPVTVTAATLSHLELAPSTVSLPIGATQRLTLLGHYGDGTIQDLSRQASFESSDPSVVTVSNALDSKGTLTARGLGQSTVTARFGTASVSLIASVTPARLDHLELTPPTSRVARLTRVHLTVTGVWTDGTTRTLTDGCTFTSSAPAVAQVSNASATLGRVTALSAGSTTLSATCNGLSGTASMVVTSAALTRIDVGPASASAAAGYSLQLSATGVFDDGTTQPLTDLVSWSSLAPSIATVSNQPGEEGLARALAQGSASLQATALGVTGAVLFTVRPATLVSLELRSSGGAIPKGQTEAVVAMGLFSDGSTATVTEMVTWSTSAPAVASVSNGAGSRGQVRAIAEGTSTISATLGAVSASVRVTVSAAVVATLSVTAPATSLPKGRSLSLVATATMSDGTTRTVTDLVTWSSSDSTVASVSNASGERGLVRGSNLGSARLWAALGAVSGAFDLQVTSAVLASIGVTAPTTAWPLGTTQQLEATGVYSDGTVSPLTTSVSWSSSAPSIASVSNAGSTMGLGSAVAQGSATVSATLGALSGVLVVTVTPAVLTHLELDPRPMQLAAGLESTLVATGIYSDGSRLDLSASASWSSSATSIATVSHGRVRGLQVGTTQVAATVQSIVGTASVEVTAAVLTSLQLTPSAPARPKGLTEPMVATGVFSDGSTQTLTEAVTWSSSDATVVSVSNAAGQKGRAQARLEGTVTLRAQLGSIVGTTPFTVTAAVQRGLLIVPGGSTASLGSVRQYQAFAQFTDGSAQPVTAAATWTSSAPAVASISNAQDSAGLATTLSTGATTITAQHQGFSASSNLVVVQMSLVHIEVTPASGATALGYSRQLMAVGTYSDGTTQVITTQVTWSSSDQAIAFVSNAPGSQGLLSTVSTGSVVITARLGTVSGSTSHTVSPAVLVLLTIAPGSLSLTPGESRSMSSTGYFSDGSSQDLTTSVTWLSTDSAVAQVSNAAGSEGVVTAIAPGATTLSASVGSVLATRAVTVSAP